MDELILYAASFLRDHSKTLCLAWTAATLAIYANHLTKFSKQTSKGWHIILRLLFFVFFWGIGIGLLTVFIADTIQHQILKLSNSSLIIITLTAFTTLGILAERKKQL